MKHLSILFAMGAIAAQATTFTINDPFNTACVPATTSCDVIGANSSFDIQKGVFNFGATSSTIQLYFNYGPNNTSIAPFNFTPSVILSLGDLFISGAGFNYGIALDSRNNAVSGSVVAGTLYSINNSNGQLTAAQALNNPGITYRPDELVWLRNDGAGSITSVANGSVSIVSGGDGVNGAEFVATITLNYAAGSTVAKNLSTGIPTIHFTSATCGNDILTNSVPEPASLGLIGAGLAAAAWRLRKKARA